MKGDDHPPPNQPGKSDGDVAESENANIGSASDSTSVVSESEVQLQQQPDREEQDSDDGDASTMALYTSRVLRGAGGVISIGESESGDGTSAVASFASTSESYEGLSDLAADVGNSRRRSHMSQPGAYAVTPIPLPPTSLRRSINDTSVDSSYLSRRLSDRLSMEGEVSDHSGTTATATTMHAVVAESEYSDHVFRVEAVAVCDDVLHAVRVDEVVQEDGGDVDVEEGGSEEGGGNRRIRPSIAGTGDEDDTNASSLSGEGKNTGNAPCMSRSCKYVLISAVLLFVAAGVICATVLTRNRSDTGTGEGSGVGEGDVEIADASDAPDEVPPRPSGGVSDLMGSLIEFQTQSLQSCPTKGHPDICGGCWCLGLSDDDNYQCPEMPKGIISGCTPDERREELASIYASFVQTGAPDYIKPSPVLQSTGLYVLPRPNSDGADVSTGSNGTDSDAPSGINMDIIGTPRNPCDPFSFGEKTHEESQSKNPFHGLKPCYPQALDPPYLNPEPGVVCSYKYAGAVASLSECRGREYELISYSSAEDAIVDGAKIVHDGPCGFCSNANDRAAFIRNKSLIQKAFGCRVKLSQIDGGPPKSAPKSGGDPSSLTKCVIDALQISQPCGTWISTSLLAYAEIFCFDDCLGDGTPPWQQIGNPPECALGECKKCILAQTETPAIALAGNEPFFAPQDVVMQDEFTPCSNGHIQTHGDRPERILFDPCDGLI